VLSILLRKAEMEIVGDEVVVLFEVAKAEFDNVNAALAEESAGKF